MPEEKKQENAYVTICPCHGFEDPIPTDENILCEASGLWNGDDPPYCSGTVLQTHRKSTVFSVNVCTWKEKSTERRHLVLYYQRNEMTPALLSWIQIFPFQKIAFGYGSYQQSSDPSHLCFTHTTNSHQLYCLHISQIHVILSFALALTEYMT